MVQDKQLSNSKEKRNWRTLVLLTKLILTALIASYIYNTFKNEQKGIADVGKVFSGVANVNNLPVFLSMLLLVPVNWALESKKWQQLVRKVEPITFWDAFRGTLTGLAVGVAAPAQLGDTIGRVAALRTDKRMEAIGAALVSNGVQFYVSVVTGTGAWFWLRETIPLNTLSKNILEFALCALLVMGLIAGFFRKRLTRWNSDKMIFKKMHSYLRIIGAYSERDLLLATFYGLARYLVFLSQFVLALSLFDFGLSLVTLACCVSLIFLAKTVIPAVNVLGDLGLREFTALFVFKQYNLPPEEIITATFTVWIVNVMGPILIGIFLIWKYKWKVKND
jgi:hypothetical protein